MTEFLGDDYTWREALRRAGQVDPYVYVALFDGTSDGLPFRHARIAMIRTDPDHYREGHASEVLAALCRVADRYRITLHLTPDRPTGVKGGMSKWALVGWYKRNGFTRNTDLRISDVLSRHPRTRKEDRLYTGSSTEVIWPARREADDGLRCSMPRYQSCGETIPHAAHEHHGGELFCEGQ